MLIKHRRPVAVPELALCRPAGGRGKVVDGEFVTTVIRYINTSYFANNRLTILIFITVEIRCALYSCA